MYTGWDIELNCQRVIVYYYLMRAGKLYLNAENSLRLLCVSIKVNRRYQQTTKYKVAVDSDNLEMKCG